jgi:hypothetical protein
MAGKQRLSGSRLAILPWHYGKDFAGRLGGLSSGGVAAPSARRLGVTRWEVECWTKQIIAGKIKLNT